MSEKNVTCTVDAGVIFRAGDKVLVVAVPQGEGRWELVTVGELGGHIPDADQGRGIAIAAEGCLQRLKQLWRDEWDAELKAVMQ